MSLAGRLSLMQKLIQLSIYLCSESIVQQRHTGKELKRRSNGKEIISIQWRHTVIKLMSKNNKY